MPSSIPNETNSLAAMFPDLARQLDPLLNNGITADMVCAFSHKLMTWGCETDPSHTYVAEVNTRTRKGAGCSICGPKIDPERSLLALRPDVARYWHAELNGSLRPDNVTYGSNRTAFWICRTNSSHTYQTTVTVRCKSYGECRECQGLYVTDENRLSLKFPKIAAEFHPTKNRMLYPANKTNAQWFPKNHFRPGEEPKRNRRITPADIPINSREDFVWVGSCGVDHEWTSSAYARTHRGTGCGVCHDTRHPPVLDNSLASMFPGVANMWHPSKNGSLKPSQVKPYSTKKRHFRCFRHADHDFEAAVGCVVRSWKAGANGCPTCKGLKVLYRDSLAANYPKVASMMRAANSKIDPETVRPKSRKITSFQCPRVAYHIFPASIADVVRSAQSRFSGCGFCRGIRVHPLDSLKERYPEVAKYIDRTQGAFPKATHLNPGSHIELPFRCFAPGRHRWTQKLFHVVGNYNYGSILCPTCRKLDASRKDR